jgi:nucleotide-binding universal stress UspA family protein
MILVGSEGGIAVAPVRRGGFLMIALKRILVPVDFSETSAAALRYGVELARGFKARLHLLHVPEHPTEAEYPIGLFETMQSAAHGRLRHLLSDADANELHPQCSMRMGTPPEEIVDYAQEHDIDLIVMGTHGRTGLARVILGSVAERVVRTAPCPVLTVHYPERRLVVPSVVIETPLQARA